MRKKRSKSRALKQAIIIGIGTFFLAILAGLGSTALLNYLGFLGLKFLLLIIIVFIGILFDTIGVAAAAAAEKPFHSMAAKKKFGSTQAVHLVRNADRVASFSSDVVGDISGVLSGAIGAAIVFEILTSGLNIGEVILSTVMTAFVAGLTVGGKAFGKVIAISYPNAIIFKVGILFGIVENTLKIRAIGNKGKKGRK